MTEQSPNESDRFQLVENYVDHIIDGMDTDSLVHMVRDLLTNEYDKLTWDEITDEIVELYDENTLIDLLPDKQPEPTEIGKLEATAPDYGVGK